MNITARTALNLIPLDLGSQPVFLCIDDTMVPKSGKKFEDVSKLFDHAAHNGSNYLNGHCFVSIMLCVPVWTETCCINGTSGNAGTCQEKNCYHPV